MKKSRKMETQTIYNKNKNRMEKKVYNNLRCGIGNFSYFTQNEAVSSTESQIFNLLKSYTYIKGDEAKNKTSELRSINPEDEKRISPDAFQKMKFDAVSFSGRFTNKSDAQPLSASGLICFDIDNLGEEKLKLVMRKLIEDAYFVTQLLFISSKGNGLKWIIAYDSRVAPYEVWAKSIFNYLFKEYNLNVDNSCLKINYLCSINHTNAAYLNPELKTETDQDYQEVFYLKKPFPIYKFVSPEDRKMYRNKATLEEVQKIKNIVDYIKTKNMNIILDSRDYYKVGFILADTFDEEGRNYFHTIVKNFDRDGKGYNKDQVDKDFSRYLVDSKGLMKVQTLIDMADNAGVLLPKIKEKEEDFFVDGMEFCSDNQVFNEEEEIEEEEKIEEKEEEPQPISAPELDPIGFKIPADAQVFKIDSNTWVVKKVG